MQASVKKPFIIAHRGTSALAPENTLAAFQKAIEDGADGLEFDVQMAKDSIPVVIHDSKLKRLGRCAGCVSDYTSSELRTLDVGTWFNEKNPLRADDRFAAESVPTLAELFDFLSAYKGLLYVELKCMGESKTDALARSVCEVIRQSNLLPNIIVKSFNLEAIRIVKQILPEIRTAALFEPKVSTILRKKKLILNEAQRYNADEISIHYSLATVKFVRQALEKSLPVTIWTADNPAWVKRALDSGIRSIITNNPARLLAKRDEILQRMEAQIGT